MPLEEVPCSSPRPNSQRAHNTVCSLENHSLFIGELCVGRRSIPRPNFASVRGGQLKTDLFRRYRSAARGYQWLRAHFGAEECHKPRQSPLPEQGRDYFDWRVAADGYGFVIALTASECAICATSSDG